MNSALNPEAPEFYPHLTSVTKDGYSTVNKTIRSSNQMPIGASFDLFKTFTDFNIVTSQISKNVIIQSNEIMKTELPAVKLKCNDNEYNSDKIIDANDAILDRVNINIDTESGVNKPSEEFLEGVNRTAPIIAKIQVGSTTFIGAKNIPRPQLTFKDTIDNSESLWVPKISDKPNNIKPLSLNIIYNDQDEAVGYEHPYQIELDLYHPPAELIEPDEGAPAFPAPLDRTPLTHVTTEQHVDQLVEHLNSVTQIAVDVEHHSYRTYQGITCLIQITTDEGGDFIIDALAVREHLNKLNLAFTDPKKIKVFHGAESDVLWLQRDFGLYIVGLFDTHHAAKALQISGLSLKYLLKKYCGVSADKKYQLADWRMRPLPDELVEYARMDTHYLLYIWRRMKAELLEAAAGLPTLLLSVFEQSRQTCGQTYSKQVVNDCSHMSLYVRSKRAFNSQQLAALQLLYKWRDAHARELDESTMYLLPNHMLLALAETLPREVQGVLACCKPVPPFVKQNLINIHRMILSCRQLPLEPQLMPVPKSVSTMSGSAHLAHAQPAYHIHDLSHLTDIRESQINLERAALSLENYTTFLPDVTAFAPSYDREHQCTIVSDLNADAKMFIPPYDRYRKYRSLAQLEELKEYKNKEAKVAALSKDSELIQREVLNKIQQAKTLVEHEDKTSKETTNKIRDNIIDNHVVEKRKRKMSTDKLENKKTVTESAETVTTVERKPKTNEKERNKYPKPFHYQNVNYKKFYDDSDKAHKQPKMKFKKHK